ncbi:MAG: hypothetical protein WC900_03260 [Oscillospiraceae bacterium]
MSNTYKWLYEDTDDIIQKNHTLPPEYKELVLQLSKRYSINILNIVFKIHENSHYAKKSCQLYVVYDGTITQSQKANINKYISLLFVEVNKKFNITNNPNVLYLTVNMLHFDEIKPIAEEEKKQKPPEPAAPEETASAVPDKAEKEDEAIQISENEIKIPEKLRPIELTEIKKPAPKNIKQPEKPRHEKPHYQKEIQKAPEKPFNRYREISFRLINKKEKLPPIFRDLRDWIDDSFGIFAVGFMLIDINSSSPTTHPVLEISFMNSESFLEKTSPEKLKDIKLDITKQFFILNRKYKICPDSYIRSFDVLFFNLSRHFKDSISKIAAENFEKFIKAVYSAIPVYKIVSCSGRTFIFFNKTRDLNKSEKTGMKAMLEEEYLNFLKKTDEYGIFEPDEVKVVFSSREILDKNFDGNEIKFCEGYTPA